MSHLIDAPRQTAKFVVRKPSRARDQINQLRLRQEDDDAPLELTQKNKEISKQMPRHFQPERKNHSDLRRPQFSFGHEDPSFKADPIPPQRRDAVR